MRHNAEHPYARLEAALRGLAEDYGLGNVVASLSAVTHRGLEQGESYLGPQHENYAKADPVLGRLALAMDRDI